MSSSSSVCCAAAAAGKLLILDKLGWTLGRITERAERESGTFPFDFRDRKIYIKVLMSLDCPSCPACGYLFCWRCCCCCCCCKSWPAAPGPNATRGCWARRGESSAAAMKHFRENPDRFRRMNETLALLRHPHKLPSSIDLSRPKVSLRPAQKNKREFFRCSSKKNKKSKKKLRKKKKS